MEPYIQKMMFRQTFNIKVFRGTDGAGDKLYDASIEIKGYYVGATKIIMTAAGQQVLSTGHFFVTAEDFVKITPGSLTTLPLIEGEWPVLHTEPYFKENGILSYGMVYMK